jgi:asparagine synthase (glutamine-hydrolysing)
MCGISGFVTAVPEEEAETVSGQIRCQHHRGPDAEGHFAGTRGVIAQNRLAIIDVAGGDPPITNEDGTLAAVLNGEIYNFPSLRTQLERGSHRLSTRCDTEVLVHLAEDLDPVGVARALDGMFAFAIWDERRQQLCLGRDRLGKKPLYYWEGDGVFVFASEIKGVLAHPRVARALEPRALSAYLEYGYVPTPLTFFSGVRSLEPGHVLTIAPGTRAETIRYWSPPEPGAGLDVTTDEAAAEVRALLRDAVRRRLSSDVPLGAFLSGGIDSSAIVALMAQESSGPVSTFTIGFDDDQGFDEREYARLVASRYGTDHHEFVVRPDAVDLLERLVWHHDQPFGDSSAVPSYLLSELTRSSVTVALCGDGGDELFAGYERFGAALAVSRYNRLPKPVRDLARRGVTRLPRTALRGRVGSAQRFAAAADHGLPDAYLDWVRVIGEHDRQRLLPDGDAWASDELRQMWRAHRNGASSLERLLDINLRTYLLDDLLVKVDRMSMAHGLEVRSPFLDTQLVELSRRLPDRVKIRGASLKHVLKRAMRDDLPHAILRRRKRGFGVPLDRWFRQDLRAYMEGRLGTSQSRVRAYVDGTAVDSLIAEHESGQRDHGHALWSLLTLEIFLRREGW